MNLFHFTLYMSHTDLNQPVPLCGAHSAATLDTDGNEQVTPATLFCIWKIMPYKTKKYFKCTRKVLGNRSTLAMYLSTSTSTLDF